MSELTHDSQVDGATEDLYNIIAKVKAYGQRQKISRIPDTVKDNDNALSVKIGSEHAKYPKSRT